MKLKKALATLSAAAVLGTGLAVVPAVAAPATSAVVQSAEAATLGWAKKACKTTYFKRNVAGTNWRIVYKQEHRNFTSSLTGTKCLPYGKAKLVRYESR